MLSVCLYLFLLLCLLNAVMTTPQEKQEQQQSSPQVMAPDGGWGWVVVGALFVASALVFGLIRSLGIFFVEFVQYFGESAQAVSWITSIGVAVQQLFSPIGTAACNVYGARPVVMIGGFLSGLGFILASQATTLSHLYLTMGLISGIGWALVFTPIIASVMQYFTTRRSLAMGLGFTGIGLASFAFSPLFQYLVEVYAWRGALLILGGLSFNMIACGALIRPIWNPKAVVKAKTSSNHNKCSRIHECFEISLLSHRGFLTYTLAITFFNAGYFIPYVHLVAHSRHIGFSEYQAAFVISVTGVADIVGRVVSGWASDLGKMRMLHMLTVWTGLLGIFLLLIPLGVTYSGLLVVSLAYGFCAGAMTPLAFAVVPEIVGMERMLGALGLLQFLESIGGLLGAPLSGWLKDYTGSYTVSFVAAGSFLVLGTLITSTLPHFWSCTSPSPPSPKSSQDASMEDGLLKQPLPSVPEKLCPLDDIPVLR
ncbi:monocarboxylate transporter 13 isoform X1 [Triplophysa rosa]|uniref:Monocarboxylate transporter 13 n=1 Tax=Triplophysa rosa TaxID=992332 RepID=A0A9W7T635_TRIRA|nr:monocarboxylate transporter 13 isoform X1 [Triplophysa rosa]XP_057183935.1 monocarboxylate transporter 13 isoform X1 [Triplophysa rosa]XP_057183936.1 monocarboxylate transporter 13 isoform X1 [Triplophysa rosa]KAI7790731.1 putative monocarboxylate transporter 13 [Triplophysa rosa]